MATRTRHVEAASEEGIGRMLCARVKELRRKRGWTLEEMSAACGVSRSMLSEIERGRANPTLAVAWRIAQAFGMSLGDLVETPAATQRIDIIRADEPHLSLPFRPGIAASGRSRRCTWRSRSSITRLSCAPAGH